jgi:AcrR family transcriptional regulator
MQAASKDVNGAAPDQAAPDQAAQGGGRKARWAKHREQRREELIQAAIEAVLHHGPEVDMDQVASVAGVSKPVLYRYFADKSQLWIAVSEHISAIVVDAVAPAVERVREERDLIEATIDAYLRCIEAQPQLYSFVMDHSAIPGVHQLIAGSSKRIAAGLAQVIGDRLRSLGLDAGPAEPWAYGLVGFVQSVGDWWMAHGRPIRRAALTEYLTTLLWSGIDGVRRAADFPQELKALADKP